METLIVELEIERTWWMWRGCLQDYYDGYDTKEIHPLDRGTDTMDRYEYKEAFPMEKPNFDVFGIPQRTRSQRGWYQIRRRRKTQQKRPIFIKSWSDAPTTGADIPIELVRLVGNIMSETLSWSEDDDRPTMTTCALVCRYWASLFLPKIFQTVEILSRKRAFELCEFDRSPACRFHQFVEPKVEVFIGNLSELSCMHILTRHKDVYLELTGPLPRKWKTIRSVHQALPRSLPSSFSSNIEVLILNDIHFQRFPDLVHLVCELPDLTRVESEKVTWGPIPDTINIPPHRRATRKGPGPRYSIWMDSDMWAQASAHIATHSLSRNIHPFFPPGAILAVASLVHRLTEVALISDNDMANAPDPDASSLSGHLTSTCDDHCVSLEWYWTKSKCDLAKIRATLRTVPSGEVAISDVTDVTVDLSSLSESDLQGDNCKKFDWREFDRQVSSLNSSRLVFAFRSRGHMLIFGAEIAEPLMPRAFARGSIKYVVWDDDKWYKASRESDVLQAGPSNCNPHTTYSG